MIKADHPIYGPAVAAIVSWFSVREYYLSSECLLHAKNNTISDSLYWPYYAFRVQGSNVFINLKNGTGQYGSAAFPNSGSTVDRDLYYAIHAFNWFRVGAKITLVDRYDFSPGDRYSGLAGTAIDMMYYAQINGYLTPYRIKVTY